MTTSRLIQEFTIAAGANAVRLSSSAYSSGTATITAGTWIHSDDGAADDFLTEIKTQFEAALVGATFTVDIVGVGVTLAGTAEGRIRIAIDSGTFSILWSNAASTLDPRVLGWPDGHTTDEASSLTVLVSDYVHLYGWYPQTDPRDPQNIRLYMESFADESTQGDIDEDHVYSGRRLEIEFENVREGLAVEAYRSEAVRMSGSDLTTGDENCSWERFCQMHVEGANKWRYYPDATDVSTVLDPGGAGYYGPFKLPGTDQNGGMQRTDPSAFMRHLPESQLYAIAIIAHLVPT